MNQDQEVQDLDTMEKKPKHLTREQIRNALRQVYTKESKPVQVKSVKKRSTIALVLIYVGTILVSISIGFKFFSLEANLILPGLLFLIIASLIGFSLTTKNIRKINRSMSRFKDGTTPAYRKVFSESRWRTQAMVYAVLFCLIFIGVQNTNFLNTFTEQEIFDYFQNEDKDIEINENKVWLEEFILSETESNDGQNYRYITVEINNSVNYYGKNLYLVAQSFYTGKLLDTVNMTFDEPDMDIKLFKILIHDAEDTTIKGALKFYGKKGERTLTSVVKQSIDEIYIASAVSTVTSKVGFISKSVEVSVMIYNERQIWGANALTVVLTNPNIIASVYKASLENNKTLYRNEYWEVKFKTEIPYLDNELDIKLYVNSNEKAKDEIRVAVE